MMPRPARMAPLRNMARSFKRELAVYRLVLKDPRTPPKAKWLLGIAVGYTILPFDIIPDFIPGLGQLDDAIIVPALVKLALRSIPKEVVNDCRRRVAHDSASRE